MTLSVRLAAQRIEEAATLGDFLTEIAARHGRLPALIIKPGFRTRVTTYARLETLALRAGRYLQQRGVKKGDRVLLWAPNMPEWVEVFFACQKIGAIPVPLDVRSAPGFVASIVRQTEPKLAFLSRVTARQAEGLDLPVVLLEGLHAELPEETELLEDVGVEPDGVAEIMFTSGTTGDPKGVMLSHRNILSNVRGTNQVIAIKPTFRLLSLLPLSHVLEQVGGMLAPLSGGARIVYPSSRQPSILFRTMAENRITMLVLVPQALQLFLNGIEREAKRQNKEKALGRLFAIAERVPFPLRRLLFRSVHTRFGGKLDLLICGGAYLDPELANKWELMGVSVLQGYGATETSPIISCDRPGHRKPEAVGEPFPGVEVRIADDGEILARGANIFCGYWGNPQATAAAMEDGWYRTGDLGLLDEGGFLHLKGRKKNIIVLANGQNVFPQDIEAELHRHPEVADGVVVGLMKEGGMVEVHAALLMREPDRAEEVVRATNERLADHQHIQDFTVWPYEDFPRTPKLEVKKQEVIEILQRLEAGEAAEAPRPQEAAPKNPLHGLIAELAPEPGLEIRPESTLGADLGLDSLGRVELLSAIEGELGVYVDETLVSATTTVADLEWILQVSQAPGPANRFVGWPLHPLAAIARELLLQLIIFPFYHLFWRVRVVGRERLNGIQGPVLITPNHHFAAGKFGMDPAAAWMGLPRHMRLRTCTAGEEHAVFDDRANAFFSRLLNAFPISKEGNVRGSLEYIGRLLDLRWSVLIFPEGNLFDGGPLHPFMSGTGLMAVEGDTPIVPMWIQVERRSILQSRKPAQSADAASTASASSPGGSSQASATAMTAAPSRWRGAFTVYIGEPLSFAPGTPYPEATERIEAAVRRLGAAAIRDSSLSQTHSPEGPRS